MKENLTVSKSFRFKPSTMEKLKELKDFLGNANMTDNLAMNLVIEQFYQKNYSVEANKGFLKRVEAALNIIQVENLDKVIEIVLDELEVLRLATGETKQVILRDFVDVCITHVKSYWGDEIIEGMMEIPIYNFILNKVVKRTLQELNVKDMDQVKELLNKVQYVCFVASDIKYLGLERAKINYEEERA